VKIKILILFSVLALLILSALQSFLLYNTYKFEKDRLTIDAFNVASEMYNSQKAESVFQEYRLDLKTQLIKYNEQEINKTKLINNFKLKCKEIDKINRPHYKKEIDKRLKFDMLFRIMVKELILYSSDTVPDTLFLSEKNRTIKVLGDLDTISKAILINSDIWQANLFQKENTPFFKLKTEVYISIDKWELLIIKDMLWILIGSIIIFIFVIILLQYSIVNLIKQKKNADIRKDFIDNITHEFKTPLSTLSIATEMLSDKDFFRKPEAVQNTLGIIKRQNIRLQGLLDQVITRSLVERNQIVVNLKFIDLPHYIDVLVSDYKIGRTTQKIEFIVSNKKYTNKTKIDEFFFSIAFLNILNNAVKYGASEIKVSLKESNQKGYCEIIIEDNGIGIDKADFKQIFDKFYRVSENNQHNYKGLGLGLFYSNEIIKAHKGRITVDSELGKGSVFTIQIPISTIS